MSAEHPPYDKTLQHDLKEIFCNAAKDLAPRGAEEVVDAAIHCLVRALAGHLGTYPPNSNDDEIEEVLSQFIQTINRAVDVAIARYAWGRR
jgi:hypothetical protein